MDRLAGVLSTTGEFREVDLTADVVGTLASVAVLVGFVAFHLTFETPCGVLAALFLWRKGSGKAAKS